MRKSRRIDFSTRPGILHVGNADSGIPMLHAGPPPNTKVIAVFRGRDEAQASFQKYFDAHPYPQFGPPNPAAADLYFNEAPMRLLQFVNRVEASLLRTITFEELDDVEKIAALWNFICPEEEFFRERFLVLNDLRVNPASEKVRV
jgi:hypothetical protein